MISSKFSLAIISTHPIQYYAPIFRLLATQINIKVFYEQIPDQFLQGKDYHQAYEWDIDLLSGYAYSVGRLGISELSEDLENGRYAAVLLMGWQTPFLWEAFIRAKAARVSVMVRGDSHLKTPRSWLKRCLKDPFYRCFLSNFDICLTVGKWNAEYYQHYGVPSNRLISSPHCVDNNWFKSHATKEKKQRTKLRAKWGFTDDDNVFLFVGRLSEMKRVGDFIHALVEIRRMLDEESGRRMKGLVVGDGALRKFLEEEAKVQGAPVNFAGFINQTEIIQAYVAADCLILPSDARETWGLVVNEGIACGLPCIVSDQVGSWPDMIQPERNGMVYQCGNAQDLAEKMRDWVQLCAKDRIDQANREVLAKHSCETAVCGILEAMKNMGCFTGENEI